jgi:hypothetical protein
MPKPYSQDLRERVVKPVEAGHSRRAAAAHFGVSASFVVNLMTSYRLRGHHDAGTGRRTRSGLWRESRSRLNLSLAYSQRLPACLQSRSQPDRAVARQADLQLDERDVGLLRHPGAQRLVIGRKLRLWPAARLVAATSPVARRLCYAVP